LAVVFTGGYAKTRAEALFAGFLMTAFANACLTILLPMVYIQSPRKE
jgi:hypothetical protein